MISFSLNNFLFHRKLIFFADEPSLRLGLFDVYIQSSYKKSKFGYRRIPKYSKLIDLSVSDFENSFNKENHYQIRKGKSDNIICRTTSDIKEFVSYHNDFINKKNLQGTISEKELEIYGDALVIRTAFLNDGQYLVFHSYLLDRSIKKVRLLHSVSNLHDDALTATQKQLIGRANRLLHYNDMHYFKEMGVLFYDFGGYAFQTHDKSLIGINNFKDSFGGTMVEESNYESCLIFAARELKNRLSRLTRKLNLRSSTH
jgi:hypothetical protein